MGKRVPFADVIAKFESKGLRLLVGEEDYHGVDARHPFLCLKHPDIEQKGTSYSKLKQDGYGCLECARIAHATAQRKPKKLRTLFSQVVNRFESKGLHLLTEEKNYRGVSVRLAFCCVKHPFNVQPGVSDNKVKDGYGCIDCVTQARTQKRRTPYSEIKAEFDKWNFVLLTPESEFTSTQIPLRYLCLRHPHIKQRPKLYHNLKVQHKGCRACTQERKDTERAKEMFPIAKQTFEEKGLILLETSYVNAKTPMRYICSKHPEVERTKTYDEARNQGCPLCANEAQSERQRTPQENVKTKCLYRGFLLIDEQVYFNAHQHLRFQCLLHPEENYTTTVSTILYGKPGCKKCKSEKISEKQKANFAEGRQITKKGSANPSWKGGTTEINTYLRQKGEPWRRKWLEHYNYTCIVSGQRGGRLVVHHSELFHKLRDKVLSKLKLPIKSKVGEYSPEQLEQIEKEFVLLLDEVEGFPIKPEYHTMFHNQYGHGRRANRESFIEFINRIAPEPPHIINQTQPIKY